ncbi:hypothetical protein MUK42_33059 [Musa troglodytarum]|uniref:Uncharacterized protein n=1 Tax=Musa troglodytarum TaxID=320322 RepID=A0A9E7EYX9_9LILI|nr:hypothetical protein MUK42_33059 [Musa troglodytarum]
MVWAAEGEFQRDRIDLSRAPFFSSGFERSCHSFGIFHRLPNVLLSLLWQPKTSSRSLTHLLFLSSLVSLSSRISIHSSTLNLDLSIQSQPKNASTESGSDQAFMVTSGRIRSIGNFLMSFFLRSMSHKISYVTEIWRGSLIDGFRSRRRHTDVKEKGRRQVVVQKKQKGKKNKVAFPISLSILHVHIVTIHPFYIRDGG